MNRRGLRDLLFVVHHGLVLVGRFCGFGDHGTHLHRKSTLPFSPSCGARSPLPANVDNCDDDKRQENEGVQSHDPEHDRDEGIEFVQNILGSRNITRRSAYNLGRGNIISNVCPRLGPSDLSKLCRSFVWIGQG